MKRPEDNALSPRRATQHQTNWFTRPRTPRSSNASVPLSSSSAGLTPGGLRIQSAQASTWTCTHQTMQQRSNGNFQLADGRTCGRWTGMSVANKCTIRLWDAKTTPRSPILYARKCSNASTGPRSVSRCWNVLASISRWFRVLVPWSVGIGSVDRIDFKHDHRTTEKTIVITSFIFRDVLVIVVCHLKSVVRKSDSKLPGRQVVYGHLMWLKLELGFWMLPAIVPQ